MRVEKRETIFFKKNESVFWDNFSDLICDLLNQTSDPKIQEKLYNISDSMTDLLNYIDREEN